MLLPMTRTKVMKRAAAILEELRVLYPGAATELEAANPFHLLVAVVLSAQCTDKKVNEVTPGLFARWPDPASLGGAPLEDVEQALRTLGLFRTKARNIIALSRRLSEEHRGRVPLSRQALEALPGVGRKTANVVLSNLPGGEPALAVDTHVGRLARRLGLSEENDPLKVERDLCRLLPAEAWGFVSHALILHGRRVCQARRPDCSACTLAAHCSSAFRALPGKRVARGR
jgi:endonuclease-3